MEDLLNEINRLKSILIVSQTEAGKAVLESLKQDVVNITDKLVRIYTTATHIELLGEIARLESTQNLIKSFTTTEEDIKVLTDELKELKKNKE